MHPHFPVVEGRYQMTRTWSVMLPAQFNRRIEEGSLVLWRPAFTIWVSVWGNDHNQTREERLALIKTKISPDAFDLEEEADDNRIRFSYRLNESSDDDRVPAYYCCVFGDSGDVLMAIYFDSEADLAIAKQIRDSLREESNLR